LQTTKFHNYFAYAFFVAVLTPAIVFAAPKLVSVYKLNPGLDSIKRLGASNQAYWAKGSSDDLVYGAYNKMWVGAYSLAKKDWRWFYQTGSHLSTAPVVDSGNVAFALRSGLVIYLDASSGAKKWQTTLPAFVNQPMVAAQGQLIVQTSESKTYALDRQTGDIVWVFESPIKPRLSLASAPAPIVTPALVFVGDASGFVYGVDRSSGRPVWRFHAGSTEAEFNGVVDSMHLDGLFIK
jgi:outer membrane protein assembly factor BamB